MQRRLAQVVGGPDYIRVRREQSTGGCQVTQAGRGQGIASRAALLQQAANPSPALRLEVLAFLGSGGGQGKGLKKRRPVRSRSPEGDAGLEKRLDRLEF